MFSLWEASIVITFDRYESNNTFISEKNWQKKENSGWLKQSGKYKKAINGNEQIMPKKIYITKQNKIFQKYNLE